MLATYMYSLTDDAYYGRWIDGAISIIYPSYSVPVMRIIHCVD